MAKPYSDDLRARVASAILEGETYRAISNRFGLAPSTVAKWAKRLRETGSVAPAKFGGHLQCTLDRHRDFIRDQVDQVPHLTLHRLKELLAERGIRVSHDTFWRFLKREGLSFKKTLLAIEQHRFDVSRRRERWRHAMPYLDPERLVFIDETWIKTNMTPIRGWGLKGQRIKGFASDGTGRP